MLFCKYPFGNLSGGALEVVRGPYPINVVNPLIFHVKSSREGLD